MTNLKPCPFCGGKARLKLISTDAITMMPPMYWHRVECISCRAGIEKKDPEQAIEAWNRRAE